MALSRLINLSFFSLCNFDIEAYKFYDRAHRLYDKGVIPNMLFGLTLILILSILAF